MKVITLFNNKGGVGKTTLAVNMASYFSHHYKKRVLFLDADPQANSTQMIIPEEIWENFYGESPDRETLINYLLPLKAGDSSLEFDVELFKKIENRFEVDLIPGHPSLSVIEDILSDAWNKCVSGDLGGFRRTNWLKGIIDHYNDEYDYMFIDVGPSLGALNRSILLNTDFVITPMGSDIFSLIGVSNIATWIKNWQGDYDNAISLMLKKDTTGVHKRYPINLTLNDSSKLIGFSIQQYVTKSFASGRRPVASYDKIVSKMPTTIEEELEFLIPEGLTIDDLNLGDIPYLYSLVPLAQSAKAPMYNLTPSEGVRGAQGVSVKRYANMLNSICDKVLDNLGDKNGD